MHPQAKDLYDAVLLAEEVELPVDLARRVFEGKGHPWRHGTVTDFVRRWHVEWDAFAVEYPALAGSDREAWLGRLATSLRLVP